MQDENERTPVQAKGASKEAQAIRDLLDELASIEKHLRPASHALDSVSADDRQAYLTELMERLRKVGDLGHRAARVIWNIIHDRRARKR